MGCFSAAVPGGIFPISSTFVDFRHGLPGSG